MLILLKLLSYTLDQQEIMVGLLRMTKASKYAERAKLGDDVISNY